MWPNLQLGFITSLIFIYSNSNYIKIRIIRLLMSVIFSSADSSLHFVRIGKVRLDKYWQIITSVDSHGRNVIDQMGEALEWLTTIIIPLFFRTVLFLGQEYCFFEGPNVWLASFSHAKSDGINKIGTEISIL